MTITHGHTIGRHTGGKATPEYRAWEGMIQRCCNARHPVYARYGGRGIAVAPEWRGEGGFGRFLAHVGERPTARHSIDRINNDGNYEPGNVRWATWSEQNQNQDRSRGARSTREDVAWIRFARAMSGASGAEIGRAFGLQRHHVNAILRGRLWSSEGAAYQRRWREERAAS